MMIHYDHKMLLFSSLDYFFTPRYNEHNDQKMVFFWDSELGL